MTYFRQLVGLTPPPRPSVAWTQARIEEAPSPDVTPTVIAGPTALSPAITDPQNPPTYTFETNNAALAVGWYRVVWIDAALEEQATAWMSLRTLSPYAPTVGDIAAILRARAVLPGGFRGDTFTDQTTPTAQQVQDLITLYAPLVFARLGRLDDLYCANAEDLRAAATALAAQRVALEVEASYWPEEVEDAAAVEARRTMLTDDMTALGEALTMCRASADDGGDGGESTSRSDPAWRFPPPTPLRF